MSKAFGYALGSMSPRGPRLLQTMVRTHFGRRSRSRLGAGVVAFLFCKESACKAAVAFGFRGLQHAKLSSLFGFLGTHDLSLLGVHAGMIISFRVTGRPPRAIRGRSRVEDLFLARRLEEL